MIRLGLVEGGRGVDLVEDQLKRPLQDSVLLRVNDGRWLMKRLSGLRLIHELSWTLDRVSFSGPCLTVCEDRSIKTVQAVLND